MSAEELAAMDAKIVADTIAEMQRQIEQLTGARHSMYDPAVAIARDIANRTPPAMSADHIPDAQGWRDIATAPRDGGDILLTYGDGGCVVARPNGDGTFDDGDFHDHMADFTHWQPIPPPPSADTKPAHVQITDAYVVDCGEPDALPGDLRERVAQIIEAAIERHNPGNSLRHTVDDADAILSLIQSERGEP